MINPYLPIILEKEEVRQTLCDKNEDQPFWISHFITFQVSFVVIWLALICANLGFSKALQDIYEAPNDLLKMAGLSVGVWFAHAVLAVCCRRMHRSGTVSYAIVGSAFFFVGMLAFELLKKSLPQQMSMPLSWTPDYVLLTLYWILSLAAVWVLTAIRTCPTKDGG